MTDCSGHGLFKFNKNYELVNKIILEDFDPQMVTVVDEQVVVTQVSKPALVFTRNLDLIRAINCSKNGRGIAHDKDGKLYICNYEGCQIQAVTLKGLDQDSMYSFGGKEQDVMKYPNSICVDGGLVYVTHWTMNDCFVSVFTREGVYVTSFGSYGQANGCFRFPIGLAVDAEGVLYVCDYGNNRIQLF